MLVRRREHRLGTPSQTLKATAVETARTTDPLISVVIIFLNGEPFLEEAIDSVFSQTYQNWELLLVDDGSNDGSTDVAKRYAARLPGQIRYLEHPNHENRGMSASRNLGIANAHGEYLAFVDADDTLLPMKLEVQARILEAEPSAGMVYGPVQEWYSWTGDPEDSERDYVQTLVLPSNKLIQPNELMPASLRGARPATCGVLVRRRVWEEVGGFEEPFRGLHEDQVFFAKVFAREPVFVSDVCGARYRKRLDSCVLEAMGSDAYQNGKLVFLEWLQNHWTSLGVQDSAAWRALKKELSAIRHPMRSEWKRAIRDGWRRIGHLRVPATRLMLRAKRRLLGSPSGQLEASPNYLPLSQSRAIRRPVGRTQLSWKCSGVDRVEVRIGGPDGPILARSGPEGKARTSALTRERVRDGLFVYLQDASNGQSNSPTNTLDVMRLKVEGDSVVIPSSAIRFTKSTANVVLPAGVRAWLRRVLKPDSYVPPVGQVRFGDLRRVRPISLIWGLDRGRPVDRYYIEGFLQEHSQDVKGRVMEIGDNGYTVRFGGDRVTQSDVLNLLEGTPGTTIVGDLADAPQIPSDIFDCIVLTETLQCIYDVKAAIRTIHRILKPGGVALVTVAGISQTYDNPWGDYWCWNFTPISARRLFEEAFPADHVTVKGHGNPLVATAFMAGLADQELTAEELDHHERGYDLEITIRATKPK